MKTGKKRDIPLRPLPGEAYNAQTERERNVIGGRIAQARRESGLSLVAFSKVLKEYGVSVGDGGLSKWETGMTVPNAYQLMALSQALGVEDISRYFRGDYQPPLDETGMQKVAEYKADLIATGKYRPERKRRRIEYVEMPVSALPVSAGTGTFLDEGNFETLRFPASSVPAGAEFGIRVSGDSMEPVYHDGQIVWVEECQELAIGEVGIFIYDGEGYLKAYDEEAAEEEFQDSCDEPQPRPVLVSYNQRYQPIPISPYLSFQIVGRVL